MTLITVSDEQARLISEASAPIVFVDNHGNELGKLQPNAVKSKPEYEISDEELAELKRRANSPGPGVTTSELLTYLKTLAPIEG